MSRTPRRTTRVVVLILAAISGLLFLAGPASADSYVCGHWVRGAILDKYNAMGGSGSALGCPTTEELTTPNGRGKYTHFQGGSIYWTATTGAHPVWGQIRTKWAAMGWETSALKFPTSDELTNPDGVGKRQQFEGGTLYWHPTKSNGVHPVWGQIGAEWGRNGWEAGFFGYPTSDESSDSVEHGIKQSFARPGTKITWSAGGTGAPCSSACVSIQGSCSERWVTYVKVYFNLSNNRISVEVTPTAAGFDDADSDTADLWQQAWRCAPYPLSRLNDYQGESLYKQLACHANFAYPKPGGGHFGGETWDLESWRSNPSWDYVLSPTDVWDHECNWD